MPPPEQQQPLVFDASILQHQTNIPAEFVWPDHVKPSPDAQQALDIPTIDMGAFVSGDPAEISKASMLVNDAGKLHGFFLVVNHGVDPNLISKAQECMDSFFGMPLSEKQRAQRKLGEAGGYASSFTGRFSSSLPWKETLSIQFCDDTQSKTVEDYVLKVLGKDFQLFGKLYQEYCEAMNNLALTIMELLGISLGVGREVFREFYNENDSILRLNYYPPCQKPDLTLGTGPHCDPTSLTILHQDHVGGLQVLVDGKWCTVNPNPQALVVNIGDTFMAQSNGKFKSCMHRAVVNSRTARKSLAFFLCPNAERVVRAPESLVESKNRVYPDFTWPTFLDFTQNHYRADVKTLDAFSAWIQQSSQN